MMGGEAIYLVTVWAVPVIIAITTAWRLGRVSFNPVKHVDPIGTILLPGILLLLRSPFMFGYAKPVPVNFRGLRWPRRGMVLVAAASMLD
jgi:Zn-dependent protease